MTVRPLTLALLLAVVACRAPSPDAASKIPIPERGPDGNATTTIAAVDHLQPPFHLSGLRVVVDGAPVYAERGALDMSPPRVVAVLELDEGPHALQVAVQATYASTSSTEDDCAVEHRVSEHFTTVTGRTHIELDVHMSSPLTRFADALALDVRVDGNPPTNVETAPPPEPADVMARLRRRIREAARNKDIILLNCLRAKSERARSLVQLRDAHRTTAVADAVDDKLRRLLAESEQCICSYPAAPNVTTIATCDDSADLN